MATYSDDILIERILTAFRKVRPDKWVASTAIDWQHVVRIEAADHDGMVTCITCGVVIPYDKANGGHWIGRGFIQTIFAGDDGTTPNCHGQCVTCNRGNVRVGLVPIRYTFWMLERYGRDECDRLLHMANGPRPSWTMLELAHRKLSYQKRIKTEKKRIGA